MCSAAVVQSTETRRPRRKQPSRLMTTFHWTVLPLCRRMDMSPSPLVNVYQLLIVVFIIAY